MANEALSSCANCGKGEEFEAELKACTACKLVKYCGRDCQIAHRSQHKNACKKRAAELHDEALFSQPPKTDDCPICFLPLPALVSGQMFLPCCGKAICAGCHHAHDVQSNFRPTCPFCRAEMPFAKEFIKMLGKRVDANDARAIFQLGRIYLDGDERLGITKKTGKGLNLYHRAAELGSAMAYGKLGVIYWNGSGVVKNETKAKQYYEKAAMAGCATSRFILGCDDASAGNFDRAIKHWLIAASGGSIMAVNSIKREMAWGDATKDHYRQALRGYQQYLDEVRSCKRDEAVAFSIGYKYLFEA